MVFRSFKTNTHKKTTSQTTWFINMFVPALHIHIHLSNDLLITPNKIRPRNGVEFLMSKVT